MFFNLSGGHIKYTSDLDLVLIRIMDDISIIIVGKLFHCKIKAAKEQHLLWFH